MTSAGTPLRRSARPGWYGSGCPRRARAGPSVLASWTAPSASASHSRGLASDEDEAATCRLRRTLAPGILSLARLSMSLRISAERERVILLALAVACARGLWPVVPWFLAVKTPAAPKIMDSPRNMIGRELRPLNRTHLFTARTIKMLHAASVRQHEAGPTAQPDIRPVTGRRRLRPRLTRPAVRSVPGSARNASQPAGRGRQRRRSRAVQLTSPDE
jgi:hypothetical protein